MKKIAALVLFGSLLTSAAMAQTRQTDKKSNKELRLEMKKEAGISDDQGKQLKIINQNSKTKLQTVRNDQTLTPEQKKVKAKSIKTERYEEVGKVLTPEQQTKIKDFKAKHPEMKKHHHHKDKKTIS